MLVAPSLRMARASPSSMSASSARWRTSLIQRQPVRSNLHTTSKNSLQASLRRKVPTPVPGEHPLETPIVQRKLPFSKRLWMVGKPGYIKWPVRMVYAVVFSTATLLGGILVWDATTYRTRYLDGVPVNPLALNPRRGGPKNLKIADFMVGDEETDELRELHLKQKLVVIGGGWGAVGALKTLNPGDYHVALVSDSTYNLFTPLLPSAAVGTLEPRSLLEPLRKIIARVHGQYINAKAVDIDMTERLVEVEAPGEDENFYIPYDKVILACGSVSNDHGVPGLNNCFQLKTIEDARKIRNRVVSNFELASLPTTTPEERRTLLSFVVCGGGPTGVEFASELYDMINEDILDYYPKLLRKEASVAILQSRDHILNTYSETISQYAESRFDRHGIRTIVNARVREVGKDFVKYATKDKDGKVTEFTLPSGFTLWSTGNAMNPFTKLVASKLPNQYHKHALEVDSHLRVLGAPLGTVYCIGDAATIETNLMNHLWELVEYSDVNRDGKIDFNEFQVMLKRIRRMFPTSQIHIDKVKEVFDKYDSDKDGSIDLNELAEMFQKLSNRLTALPATAQVAEQQGKYLGKKLNRIAEKGHHQLQLMDVQDDIDDIIYEPFSYRHLGSLAYIGNSAVFDFNGYSLAGGLAAMYLWRSIYWSEGVSMRTRLLLLVDWVKRGIWGRDLSKL